MFQDRKQTPKAWMRNLVMWYSKDLMHKIGAKKIKKYLDAFDYDNKNISEINRKDTLMQF